MRVFWQPQTRIAAKWTKLSAKECHLSSYSDSKNGTCNSSLTQFIALQVHSGESCLCPEPAGLQPGTGISSPACKAEWSFLHQLVYFLRLLWAQQSVTDSAKLVWLCIRYLFSQAKLKQPHGAPPRRPPEELFESCLGHLKCRTSSSQALKS